VKVLALTISAGKGHNKAAEALKTYFSKNNKNVDMEVVDALKYINPIVDKLIVGSYLKSLKKTPLLYGKLYEYAESDDAISNVSGLVNDVLSIKIKGLIEDSSPDVIVCTHPFPLEMLSILKRKGKTSVPVVAILTDYAPHSFWFYSHIDAYVIPHEDFTQDLIEKGISKETIYPLGIPVCEGFLNSIEKKAARNLLNIDENKLTLLIMGGGLGIGNMKNIFENLAFSSLDIQLIACTGSNLKLKNQLEDISSRCNKRSLVYDYTDQVSTLMSACDILITKPGGLTITEALIKHLPIVITSTIPGQEEKNADYLLNNGIAARIKNSDSIVTIVKQIASSEIRLKYMREIAREKSKPNATEDICNLILSINKQNSL
jgi:processive 1,2-diacylglycerol beta-glucosyltransferase